MNSAVASILKSRAHLKRKLAHLLLFFFFFLGYSFFNSSQAQVQSCDNCNATWTDPGTWYDDLFNPVSFNDTNNITEQVTVNGFIRRSGSLSFNRGGGSDGLLEIKDTLVVNGNLDFKNEARLRVLSGGILIVYGDFYAKNKVHAENGGTIIVTGIYDAKGSSQHGGFDNSGKVYLFNPPDLPESGGGGDSFEDLRCDADTCGYGDSLDMVNDPDVFALFSSGGYTINVDGPATFCAGDSTKLFTINDADNYQWYKNDTLIANATDSIFYVKESGNYRVDFEKDATNYSLTPVTINVLQPQQPSITGNLEVCEASEEQIYTTEAGMSDYNWAITGGTIKSGQSSETITIEWGTTGAGSVSVIYTGVNGCTPPSPTDSSVTIHPLPVVSFTGLDAFYCADAPDVSLTGNPQDGGGTFMGTGINDNFDGTATFSPPAAGSGGPYEIIYQYTDSKGCMDSDTVYTTIYPLPDPSITGVTMACEKQTSLTYFTEAGMTGYNWGIVNGSITSGLGTNTITVDWPVDGTGHVTVTYTDGNGCTPGAATDSTITVNPLPDPVGGFTAFDTMLCPGSSGIVFTVGVVPNATGYNWTLPMGATITGGANSNSIIVDFDNNAENGLITAEPYNSCGSTNDTSLNIHLQPAIYYSVASGDFTDANLWSTTSGGTGNYTYDPAMAINSYYVIENGHTVTISGDITARGIKVGDNSGLAATLNIDAGLDLPCVKDSILIVDDGVINLNGNYLTATGDDNQFKMTGGKLNITTNISDYLIDFENITLSGGIIDYNLNGDQEISPYEYYHLQLSQSGTKTINNTIITRGDITIGSGTTLRVGNTGNNISIYGNWINNGTYDFNGKITHVEFANAINNQTISGYTEFQTLRVNKSASASIALSTDIKIIDNLNFEGEGIIQPGTSDLILGTNVTAVNSSTSDFDANRMIQLSGSPTSGRVIKELNAASNFYFVFPIGTGSNYSPAHIGPLTATVTGTGTIAVNAVPFTTVATDIVKKYWEIESANISSITSAEIKFEYTDAEEEGTPTRPIRTESGTNYDVDDPQADFLNNYFGAGSGNTSLDGQWRFVSAASIPVTYYSYQSGNWNDPNTWTTDPTGISLTGQPAAGPTSIDNVVILNGRTVTMNIDQAEVTGVEIRNGGTLDLATTTQHSFSIVSGTGTLKLSTNDMPVANYTAFVAPGGGTIEYYNFDGELDDSFLTYNHLIFSGTGTKKFGANATTTYTVNGDFILNNGTVILGNNTNKINLYIHGDFNIASSANFGVGNFNRIHDIYFYGDFENNGNTRFTNQASPDYYNPSTVGAANTIFSGLSNNTVDLNNNTDFYRLVVRKGSDQTYILSVSADAVSSFELFGPADLNSSGSPPNRTARNALAVESGTIKLGSNIEIPRLTVNPNYDLDSDAQIWMTDNSLVTIDGNAMVVYGRLRIGGNSTFNAVKRECAVIRETGEIMIEENATVNMGKFRISATAAEHRGSWKQFGGTVNITGEGSSNDRYAQFCLPHPSNIFIMTGGELNIMTAESSGMAANGGIQLGSAEGNYMITGGTVNITIPGSSTDFGIASSVPFYNLNVYKNAGGSGEALLRDINFQYGTVHAYPLRVINDFTITNQTTPAVFNANGYDITVMGDFTIQNGSSYTPGNNTSYISGIADNQILNFDANVSFNNLVVNNSSTGKTVTLAGSGTTNINSNLHIENGIFNDGGKNVTVNGNLTNDAIHEGTGRLIMKNSVSTVSTISGDGSGTFSNLEIDDSDGVIMAAVQEITGTLMLTDGILDIGNKTLFFTSGGNINVSNPSASKMIRTTGSRSDGGITKQFTGTTGLFLYPVGSSTSYTPAEIEVSSGTHGSVNLRPVNLQHPLITIPPATTNDALNYYWDVNSSGFSGISSFEGTFYYDPTDVPVDDAAYVSAKYDESLSAWDTQNGVDVVANSFHYQSSNTVSGEYTCGNIAAFGDVAVYESIASGNWENPGTWKRVKNGVDIENPALTTPGALNPVRINDGHTITITGSSGAVSCGSLEISSLGVLDLGTTISTLDHNFGTLVGEGISGNGTIRLSSTGANARFPAGDFGDFIGTNGGKVEYYRVSTDFTLPSSSIAPTNLDLTTYANLTVDPNGGNIYFPNLDLRIFKNLNITTTAGSSSVAMFSTGNSGDIIVDSNLVVNGNAFLQFGNNNPRDIRVNGNILIEDDGTFEVSNSGTAVDNMIILRGDLKNYNIIDLYKPGGFNVDVTFTGAANATIEGTGSTTDFNRLIIDKGNDFTYLVEVTSSAFTLSGSASGTDKSLELVNGAFKLSANHMIVLSSGNNNGSNFRIPSTAKLWIDNGTARINATGTNAGMFLAGNLTISGNGNVDIQSSGSNDNYLEYSGVGYPELEMQGGTLTIGSQLRRLTSTITGSLNYKQTGGTVIIGTQNAPANARAVFEVLNTGSNFTMSGGEIFIVRRQNNPVTQTILLQPESYSVTGGTITFGHSSTPSNRDDMYLNSNIKLWNLNINNSSGFGTSLTLEVNNLSVGNNLIINNNASFISSDLDVNISGDMTNNGTYTPGANTTTFNGTTSNQSVSGNLTFNNLVISNTSGTGNVILNDNIQVNGILILDKGILNDNGNIITTTGQVVNNAGHSSSSNGRLLLNGSLPQTLSGDGTGYFGSIEIDNAQGVTLSCNQQVNNKITFTDGLISLENHRLTVSADFSFDGMPSGTSMIKTSGSISDQGVRLMIPSTPFNYTLPIGSSNKYTPVTYSSATNVNAGYIDVKPINSEHPLTTDGDPRELKYYWNVTSGGLTGTTLTHTYQYVDADVLGRGTEANYACARYNYGTSAWELHGNVNSASNQIILSDASFIDGDYTAGETNEFGTIINYYETAQSGDWDTPSTWVGNIVPPSNGITRINSNHVVTVNANFKKVFTLTIDANAELNVQNTFGHDFGTIDGTGMLTIGNANPPSGEYTSFTASTGGTIKYTGSAYTISSMFSTYNNLVIASSGTLQLPMISQITINGDLTIESGILSATSQQIILNGDFTNNDAYISGNSTISFNGTSRQIVSGTTTSSLYRMVVNKPAEDIELSAPLNITDRLTFSNGKIISNNMNVLNFGNSATHAGASQSSHVEGPVSKTGNGGIFSFPVGKNNYYHPLSLSGFSDDFRVEYFNSAYNQNALTSPLNRTSDFEHWQVNRISGSSEPDITLSWSNGNEIPVINDINNLRLAYWDGNNWRVSSASASINGSFNSGSLTGTGFSELDNRVTFGSISTPKVRCPGDSTILYQASTLPEADDYTWSVDSNHLAGINVDPGDHTRAFADFTTLEEGTGNIILEVLSNGNTIIKKHFPFTLYPRKPEISAGGTTTFCEGDSVILSAPSGYNDYNWSDGETMETNKILTTGDYKVRVQHNNGCWSAFSDPVAVTVQPTPETGNMYNVPNR